MSQKQESSMKSTATDLLVRFQHRNRLNTAILKPFQWFRGARREQGGVLLGRYSIPPQVNFSGHSSPISASKPIEYSDFEAISVVSRSQESRAVLLGPDPSSPVHTPPNLASKVELNHAKGIVSRNQLFSWGKRRVWIRSEEPQWVGIVANPRHHRNH
jgi:hypothetical protein